MSSKSHLQTLFAYHWHTTQQLVECAAKLSTDAYMEHPGFGHGSVHDLLFHLLRTNISWRRALETGRQLAPVKAEDYPTIDILRAGFEAELTTWQSMLERLSDNEIEASVSLLNWRGESWTIALWRVLHHLVLHGMQHHAELAQLLTSKGQSPGNIDFIFYG